MRNRKNIDYIYKQNLEATVDKGIHNKFTKTELPTLYNVPPKRGGRYFCILAEEEGTTPPGSDAKVGPFFHGAPSGARF